MSSHASDAIRIDLQGVPRAERVADVLILVAAGAAVWVASHGNAGVLLVALAALLGTVRPGRVPAGPLEVVASAATRQVGPTLVVRMRRAGRPEAGRTVWLTPFDLPQGLLRRLTLRVRAQSRRSRS